MKHFQVQRRHDALPLTLQGYHWACAAPAATEKAPILITHGLGEHALRYAELAAWFTQRGHAVYAYDLRGHGASMGARAALPSGDDLHADGYVHDLAAVFDAVAIDAQRAPIVLGHSLGGLITARFVTAQLRAPAACVLSSPALGLHANAFERQMIRFLPRLAPNLALPNGLKVEGISHDPQVVAAYRADPLVHGVMTPRMVGWMQTAIESVHAAAATLSVPTLLLFASDDALVQPAGSRRFAEQAPAAQLSTQEITGAFHEIFNEAAPWRERALSALDDWLALR